MKWSADDEQGLTDLGPSFQFASLFGPFVLARGSAYDEAGNEPDDIYANYGCPFDCVPIEDQDVPEANNRRPIEQLPRPDRPKTGSRQSE